MFAYLTILIGIYSTSCWNVQPAKLYAVKEQLEQYSSDLSFGARQVDQFICDRPDTAALLQQEHVLRLTLIWYFAGRLTGQRVYWDNREPVENHPAVHSPANSEYPVMV